MSTLIEKVRQINQLLQQKNMFSLNTDLPYDKMAISLGDILDSNAYIINNIGILLGYYEGLDVNNARIKTMFEEKKLPYEYTNATKQLNETTVNIPITSDLTAFPIEWRQKFLNGVTTIIPIYGTGERLGTIILSRMEKKFDDEDLILAEYSVTVVGMQILHQKARTIEEEVRNTTSVKMAIDTLSYSELKAIRAIFKALDGTEGRLTTSSIADDIGITRSVIVNALRKLESAGIIDSKSLGMKGTYIKILNNQFINELEKEY